MPVSVAFIRQLERVEPGLRDVLLALLEELERQREESVTRKEFLEFAEQTKENFQRVWKAIEELTEAQTRTEEAQKRTEARIEELTEAQKRTEEELRLLIDEHRKTRGMVGGLSDTVGYGLEDQIFPYIEDFVRKEYQIEPEVLDRRSVVYPDGRYDEINIYVEGSRDGEQRLVVGECKARPGKKDVKRFSQVLERLSMHSGKIVEGFIVGYYYPPQVLRYISDNYPDIKIMKSFEFRLRYKPYEVS